MALCFKPKSKPKPTHAKLSFSYTFFCSVLSFHRSFFSALHANASGRFVYSWIHGLVWCIILCDFMFNINGIELQPKGKTTHTRMFYICNFLYNKKSIKVKHFSSAIHIEYKHKTYSFFSIFFFFLQTKSVSISLTANFVPRFQYLSVSFLS